MVRNELESYRFCMKPQVMESNVNECGKVQGSELR